MATFGGEALVLKVGADLTQFDRKMTAMQGRVKGLGGMMSKPFKIGAAAILAFETAAVAAVSAFAVASIKSAAQFEKAFGEVKSILDKTRWNLQKAESDVKKFAITLGEDINVAMRGLYQVISRGFGQQEDAMKVLKSSMTLAKAGLSDTETSVRGVTAALSSWNLTADDASRIADIFAAAVRIGGSRLEGLTNNLGKVASLAANAGVSFEEVMAAIAILTQKGLSAEEAFTGLKAIIRGLVKPTAESEKIAKELGITLGFGFTQSEGLAGALEILYGQARKLEEQGGRPLAETFEQLFGDFESLSAVMSLGGKDVEAYTEAIKELRYSAGAAAKMAEENAKTFEGQMQRLSATWQSFKEEIGGVILPALTEFMTSFVDSYTTELGRLTGNTETAKMDKVKAWKEMGESAGKAAAKIATAVQKIVSNIDILIEAAKRLGPWGPIFNTITAAKSRAELEYGLKEKGYWYGPMRQYGGLLGTGAYGADIVPFLGTRGEMVINRNATAAFFPLLQAINAMGNKPAGPSYDYSMTNTFNVNVTNRDDQAWVRNVLAPAIERTMETVGTRRQRGSRG